MLDHFEVAESMLGVCEPSVSAALTHAVLALCERLDELSCLVAVPGEE